MEDPTFSIVVPVDVIVHNNEHPFCLDDTCPCHKDPVLIAPIADAVEQGLLTEYEATLVVGGKTI